MSASQRRAVEGALTPDPGRARLLEALLLSLGFKRPPPGVACSGGTSGGGSSSKGRKGVCSANSIAAAGDGIVRSPYGTLKAAPNNGGESHMYSAVAKAAASALSAATRSGKAVEGFPAECDESAAYPPSPRGRSSSTSSSHNNTNRSRSPAGRSSSKHKTNSSGGGPASVNNTRSSSGRRVAFSQQQQQQGQYSEVPSDGSRNLLQASSLNSNTDTRAGGEPDDDGVRGNRSTSGYLELYMSRYSFHRVAGPKPFVCMFPGCNAGFANPSVAIQHATTHRTAPAIKTVLQSDAQLAATVEAGRRRRPVASTSDAEG